MPTETLPTRAEAPTKESLSRGFWLAITLHAGAFAGLFVAAWVGHSSRNWGSGDPIAGSIQANVVSAIPLPPKQRFVEDQVLASEHSSAAATPTPPAPKPTTAPKAKAEPAPKPNEVLIPTKTQPKPTTKAEHTEPAPTAKPPVPAPPTPKATSGTTSGMQLPQSMVQMKNGTALLTVEDRTFGDRYAYYIQIISRKISESKAAGDPDGPETRGKKAIIRFTIGRDGTPTDATVLTPSGSSALDISTLRAIQRIDTFGPLPEGDHKVIRFEYDSK
jgi:periplasmic protein TonB